MYSVVRASMPSYIIKVEGYYCDYSTVVDAITCIYRDLQELKDYTLEMRGKHGLAELEERLVRVEAKGTSCVMDDSVEETLAGNRMLEYAPFKGRREPVIHDHTSSEIAGIEPGETYKSYRVTWDEIVQSFREDWWGLKDWHENDDIGGEG